MEGRGWEGEEGGGGTIVEDHLDQRAKKEESTITDAQGKGGY